MFGLDVAIVTAVGGAIVLILGAAAKGIVEVIKALHEARDTAKAVKTETAQAVVEAKVAVVEAKDQVASGTDDIKGLLGQLGGRFTNLERKVDASGRKVDSLGKDQAALLDIVTTLDSKVNQHIKDSNHRLGVS